MIWFLLLGRNSLEPWGSSWHAWSRNFIRVNLRGLPSPGLSAMCFETLTNHWHSGSGSLLFWVLGLSVTLPGPYPRWILISLFFLFFEKQIVYIYLCNKGGGYAHMPWCACGGQRTAGANCFSASTTWGPGNPALTPLRHLSSPEISFSGLSMKVGYQLFQDCVQLLTIFFPDCLGKFPFHRTCSLPRA